MRVQERGEWTFPQALNLFSRSNNTSPPQLIVSDPAAGHPSMLTATTMLKADAGDGVRLFVTVTRDMFSGLGRAGIRTGDVSENRTFIVPYILPYVIHRGIIIIIRHNAQ